MRGDELEVVVNVEVVIVVEGSIGRNRQSRGSKGGVTTLVAWGWSIKLYKL